MNDIDWNLVLGVPAVVAGVPLMWAFRRYVFTWRGTVTQHLGASLFWLHLRTTGRTVWWDVFVGFGLGNVSNWIWNLLYLLAAYHSLKALHLLIPAQERASYPLLLTPFYPYKMFRRLRDQED